MESHDCTFRCGKQPCGGGSCEPTSVTVTCPEGTRCKTPSPYTLAVEPCTAIDDAGPDGATDADGIDGG
ncbi:MAG: hypothetical protein HYV09_00930 [Deltaproteobacteria bacterium]|nr:hypothetical protein [Deltaproteobacteria bacterium]